MVLMAKLSRRARGVRSTWEQEEDISLGLLTIGVTGCLGLVGCDRTNNTLTNIW
jgi:hypothetical protein